MEPKKLGQIGEKFASLYVSKLGYKVISSNFKKSGYFEIDLVARKGSKLAFIEVKTRTALYEYEQYKAFSRYKIFKVRRGVWEFLKQNPCYYNYDIEIYGLLILVNPYNFHLKYIFEKV